MKTSKKLVCMLVWLLFVAVIADVSGQRIVSYPPTNYSSLVTIQNDTSTFNPWGSWENVSSDAEDLGANVLVLTHTAFLSGQDQLGIKQLVDIYLYDGRTGFPLGGYNLTVFGVNRRNGGIRYASTNVIAAAEMFPISEWQPYRVGSRTVRSGLSRTLEHCSSIVMTGRNISSSPYVLVFPCGTETGKGVTYPFRFAGSERKLITLSVKEANFQATRGTGRFRYFWFNPDNVDVYPAN